VLSGDLDFGAVLYVCKDAERLVTGRLFLFDCAVRVLVQGQFGGFFQWVGWVDPCTSTMDWAGEVRDGPPAAGPSFLAQWRSRAHITTTICRKCDDESIALLVYELAHNSVSTTHNVAY
jgi:hypothetical protein